ncbi:MAG: hypothetical protein WBL25_02275 [Anaerolineales bacterium]
MKSCLPPGRVWWDENISLAEVRQRLVSLLEQDATYGEVRIKRRDGQVFVIKPEKRGGSPLTVEGIKLRVSREGILQSIEEGHRELE